MLKPGQLSPVKFRRVLDSTPWLEDHWNFLISVLAITLCGIILLSGITVIPSGHIGVLHSPGNDNNGRTLSPGVVYHAPFWQSIRKINIRSQNISYTDDDTDGKISGYTKESKAMTYTDITVSYKIQESEAAWIVDNIKDYQNSLISNYDILSATQSAMSTLSTSEAENRQKAATAVVQALQSRVDGKYGRKILTITDVAIKYAYVDQRTSAKSSVSKVENENETVSTDSKARTEDSVKDDSEAESSEISAEYDQFISLILSVIRVFSPIFLSLVVLSIVRHLVSR